MAKLHSSSETNVVDATTYFVIMEPYELGQCSACHPATPCMPLWGQGGELEYTCGSCATGFDSSLCADADCPECTGALIVCLSREVEDFCRQFDNQRVCVHGRLSI